MKLHRLNFHVVCFQLQDLAVSPGLQDPQLNTAECVVEGHEPNISATGRAAYIRATLYFSFIFTICFGPLLALTTFAWFEIAKVSKAHMVKAVKGVSWFILVVEIGLLIAVFVLSGLEKAPWDIYLILTLIVLEGLVMPLVCPSSCCPGKLKFSIFLWANLTAYHICWLVIGIMINALWGVIVLLFVCVSIAATIFAVYNYCYYTSGNTCTREDRCHNFIVASAGLLSVLSLVFVVIFARQANLGGETTDDIVKTVILYVTTAFISWILPKEKEEGNETADTPLTETNPSETTGLITERLIQGPAGGGR